MRLFTRLIVCAATAMLLSAVLFHMANAWFGDKSGILSAGRQLLWEARRTAVLQERTEMVARSLAFKREIIDQLFASRIDLRQAIAKFQEANELVDNVDLELVPAYRTPTDPPGVGLQVLMWVRNSVASRPTDKARQLLTEVECEYRTLFKGAKLDEEIGMRPLYMIPTGRTESNSTVW